MISDVITPILKYPKQIQKVPISSDTVKDIEFVKEKMVDYITDEKDKEFLTDACILRYLKATKFNIQDTVSRLKDTLDWRRSYKPDEITADEVAPEALTGKQIINGFDKKGRPILYLIPARENTKDYERQLKYVCFNLERLIKIMPENVESFVIIIDYENLNMFSAPPLSVSKTFLSVLANHYPERLEFTFFVNPSWYLWVFFKLMKPFVDPKTIAKMNFCDLKKGPEVNEKKVEGTGGYVSLLDYIDSDNLLCDYGGTFDLPWNFETYWKYISEI